MNAGILWIVVTLVYLNSSLNPILYCWKIKEVRQDSEGHSKKVLLFIKLSSTDNHTQLSKQSWQVTLITC